MVNFMSRLEISSFYSIATFLRSQNFIIQRDLREYKDYDNYYLDSKTKAHPGCFYFQSYPSDQWQNSTLNPILTPGARKWKCYQTDSHKEKCVSIDTIPTFNLIFTATTSKHLPIIWQAYTYHASSVILIMFSLSLFLIVKETGSQGLSNLPKITHAVNNTPNQLGHKKV